MTTAEYMNYILKYHMRIRADIAMLEHELDFCESAEETISALSFQSQDYGSKIQSSIRQDVTARIAMIYHKEHDRAVRCASSHAAVCAQLDACRRAISFLDHAFVQLQKSYPKLYDMIDALYTRGLSWKEFMVERQLSSQEQVSRMRKRTIDILSEWWDGNAAMENDVHETPT